MLGGRERFVGSAEAAGSWGGKYEPGSGSRGTLRGIGGPGLTTVSGELYGIGPDMGFRSPDCLAKGERLLRDPDGGVCESGEGVNGAVLSMLVA